MNYQKPTKIRSKALRQSARGERCTLRLGNCSGRDTVVLCHLNTVGKGMGTKSSDIFGLFACSTCHSLLDSNKVNERDILRAYIETMQRWVDMGIVKLS